MINRTTDSSDAVRKLQEDLKHEGMELDKLKRVKQIKDAELQKIKVEFEKKEAEIKQLDLDIKSLELKRGGVERDLARMQVVFKEAQRRGGSELRF